MNLLFPISVFNNTKSAVFNNTKSSTCPPPPTCPPSGDCDEPTSDCDEPTSDCDEPTSDCDEPTSDCDEPTSDCDETIECQSTQNCTLPINPQNCSYNINSVVTNIFVPKNTPNCIPVLPPNCRSVLPVRDLSIDNKRDIVSATLRNNMFGRIAGPFAGCASCSK